MAEKSGADGKDEGPRHRETGALHPRRLESIGGEECASAALINAVAEGEG